MSCIIKFLASLTNTHRYLAACSSIVRKQSNRAICCTLPPIDLHYHLFHLNADHVLYQYAELAAETKARSIAEN
jgi:hypothetical protein